MKEEIKAIYYFQLGKVWEYPHPNYAYGVFRNHPDILKALGYTMKGLKLKYASRDAPKLIVEKLSALELK